MKHVGDASLSRHRAPDFLIVAGLELMQLRKLSWLARAMFTELLALADHIDGKCSTSYAVLGALLRPDQPAAGPRIDAPSLKRLRAALSELDAVRLVRLDRIKNEKAQGLFLRVPTRAGISTSTKKQGRELGRVRKPADQALARPSAGQPPRIGQGIGQGVQEEKINSPSPQLSTAPTDIRALLAETKRRLAANRIQQPPSGG